jgi:hypothetical protein
MATTTNYGWDTPDDTDLVKDGAAAIRTLGSSVDTTTKALNPSTTLGDIEYRSATANTNTRLGIGTSGQVLAVSGGGVPEWVTAGGGGKVLQVVEGRTSTGASNSTTTYADTGATATITPSSASSKILVLVSVGSWFKDETSLTESIQFNCMRAATQIQQSGTLGFLRSGATLIATAGAYAFSILDTPATTSATTYKVQFRLGAGTGTVYVQDGSNLSTIVLMEIGA